ncbi:MAG: DUF4838 domain-containing protein [Armatimonadota bacterium]|nr:MAG: DUF4838 domain-containing protein [Armatimonadota bacterium]
MLAARVLAVSIFALAVASPSRASGFVIARDGAPQCVIQARGSAAASPADELARYVERIVGAPIPRAGTAPKLVVRVEPALGAAVRLGTAQGRNLVIAGGSEEQTWHAVYRFLYRLGCRWVIPGEIGECIPSRPSLSVEPAAGPYTPSFPLRVIWYAYGNPDGDPNAMPRFDEWARRNCLTRHGGIAHGHNLLSPIPPEEHFDAHPEYYALVQEERRPTQPCTTNPDVIRITADHLLAYFRAHPGANSYSLCVEDNGDFCQCPNCTALDASYRDAEGKELRAVTDRMLVFYNQVAEAVAREFPDKLISIYAYSAMVHPPVREKVHPNLAVFFCATFDPAHSIADPVSESRRVMRQWLARWCAASSHVYLYEYDPIPYVFALHCPLFDANARAMQSYRELGVHGVSFESYKSWASTFPNYYFNAQMLWDSTQNPQALLRDLCGRFFGAAGPAMYDYYHALASAWARNATNPGWGDDNLWRMFPPQLINRMRVSLRHAEAAKLTAVERERVQMVRYAFDFLTGYLAAMPLSREARAADAPGSDQLPIAVGFDYDAALNAGERCVELFDEMLAADNDFVLASPARARFNRRLLAVKQLWPFSSQFLAGYESVMLPDVWRIKLDRQGVGLAERWFAPELDDSAWDTASTLSQWYKQGGERGQWKNLAAWGRARFFVPADWAGRRVRMFVGATDEYGSFYVNGELAYRHPAEEHPDSWAMPFDFDITDYVLPGDENVVAVQCGAEGSLGGVWRPVAVYTAKR